MRKLLVAALLAASLALAGCSDSSDDTGSTGAATSSSTSTSTGPPPKPVVLSDTLHFLAPPEMAPALPDGSSETSTPAVSGFGGPGGGGGGQQDEQGPEWTYVVGTAANVSNAEVHVWIEITETLVPSPFTNPTQPACTWILFLQLGADDEGDMGCLTEPAGPISPGTKELVFNFVGLDAELELNETITASFFRTAFSTSMNTPVNVLSGSSDHDSRAILGGLKEPVPAK